MSIFAAVVVGLLMGAVFGLALEKGRVLDPGVIVDQFRFRRWAMLKMFLAATATGAIVLAGLTFFGLAQVSPKAVFVLQAIVGGSLLGIGIALAGACPGTSLAQIGAGYRDALFVVVGGLFGAATYAYGKPVIDATLFVGEVGRTTLATYVPLPFWLLATLAAAVMLAAALALEAWRPWRTELDDAADGLLQSEPQHKVGSRQPV